MLFTKKNKMADLIHQNYQLLPIFNRFNIQLGFGDKSVAEICSEQGVNPDFFLEIVNSFNNKDYFPQSQLKTFSLKLIIDYIKKSHDYYLEFKIPQIEKLLCNFISQSEPENSKHIGLLEKFFKEYKEEFDAHIRNEDDVVHPYVLTLEKAYNENKITEAHRRLVEVNSINHYADEHDNIEEKLYDLKNLIIKYLPPSKDSHLTNALLIELFRLERDLNDHARIEDKVLIPKVQELEKIIMRGEKE